MEIIENSLRNFSSGELTHFVGLESIDFAKNILERDVDHTELVNALFFSLGIGLIQDPSFRSKLIERMRKSDVDKVIAAIVDIYSDKPEILAIEEVEEKYEFLSKFSNVDIDNFAKALGVSEEWNSSKNNSARIKGITKLDPEYPLYSYQSEIAQKALQMIDNQQDTRAIIHLPTGSGKTRTAMNIACMHLRQNPTGLVVWLADTQELCSQASSEFRVAWKYLGNRSLKIYSYYADTEISLGGVDEGFLVAGLQKLNAARRSDRKLLFDLVAKNASLVIFDEAHKAIANTYSEISSELAGNVAQDSFLLGLTATPGRTLMQGKGVESEGDMALSQFFNGKKISMRVAGYMSPLDYLISNKYLARPEFLEIDYADTIKYTFANNSDLEIRETLSEVESRNRKILAVIEREAEQNSSVIVFACSVQHARDLASCLCFMGIEASSLDSALDDDFTRRNKISAYLKGDIKVLINFNILTAGFDAPKTNVAVIARPTSSLVQYSQMVGRAMRGTRSGGNDSCRIYTVADDIDEFRNVAAAFEHWDEIWTNED